MTAVTLTGRTEPCTTLNSTQHNFQQQNLRHLPAGQSSPWWPGSVRRVLENSPRCWGRPPSRGLPSPSASPAGSLGKSRDTNTSTNRRKSPPASTPDGKRLQMSWAESATRWRLSLYTLQRWSAALLLHNNQTNM